MGSDLTGSDFTGSDPLARGGPTWGFDAQVLSALRVRQARAAMAAERPDLALMEAEELLDEHPDDLVALRISGEAALRLGDAATAVAAFDGIVRRRLDDVDGWAALARARLEAGALDGALEACEQALSRADASPDDQAQTLEAACAEAHFVRGLVRARRQLAGAADDFQRAAALAPTRLPVPSTPPQAAFDTALRVARGRLPSPAAALLADVPIDWAAYPSEAPAAPGTPPTAPLAWATPRLTPRADGDWPERPDGVWLFRDNLAWPPCDAEALADRVLGALCDVVEPWTQLADTEQDAAG